MKSTASKTVAQKAAALLAAGWGGVAIVTEEERLGGMRSTRAPGDVLPSLAWTIEICPATDAEPMRMRARLGRFGWTRPEQIAAAQ